MPLAVDNPNIYVNENYNINFSNYSVEKRDTALLKAPTKTSVLKQFYVDVNGNDSNNGNANKPVASIKAVKTLVKNWRAQNPFSIKGIIQVIINEGVYTEKIKFTEEDSGTEDLTIVYKGNGNVSFTGGISVDHKFIKKPNAEILNRFEAPIRDKIKMIKLSDIGLSVEEIGAIPYFPGNGNTHDKPVGKLYINNKKLEYARYPRKAENGANQFLYTKTVESSGTYLKNGVKGEIGDPNPCWTFDDANIQSSTFDGIEYVHGYFGTDDVPNDGIEGNDIKNDFISSQIKIEWYDQTNNQLSLNEPAWYGVGAENRFYIFNKIDLIANEGDCVYDFINGIFYFIPPSNFNKNSSVEISAGINAPITINSDYLKFENIEVKLTRAQNAIDFRKSNNIEFNKINIKNVEGNGLVGSKKSVYNNVIKNFKAQSIGNSPLVFGGGDLFTQKKSGSYAINIYCDTYNSPVYIEGVAAKLLHFEIKNCPERGVAFAGNDIEIGYGKMFNICYDVTDFGYIYAGRNLSQTNNYIHDIYASSTNNKTKGTGIQVIYLDDMLSFVKIKNIISNNAAAGVQKALLKVNGGVYTTLENSIAVGDYLGYYQPRNENQWIKKWSNKNIVSNLEKVDAFNENSKWNSKYQKAHDILGKEPSHLTNVIKNSLHIGKGKSYYGVVNGLYAVPEITHKNIEQTEENPFKNNGKDNFYISKEDWEASPTLSSLEYIDFSKFGLLEISKLNNDYVKKVVEKQ